jgi:hypothetical protein
MLFLNIKVAYCMPKVQQPYGIISKTLLGLQMEEYNAAIAGEAKVGLAWAISKYRFTIGLN